MKNKILLKWVPVVLLLMLLAACLWLIATQSDPVRELFRTHPALKMAVRTAIVAIALALWFLTQSLISACKGNEAAIGDLLHVLSEPWNDHLRAHPRLTNILLILSSAGIDAFGLFLLGAGLFGSSLRPFIGLLMLFVFRQACQMFCALPIPPKMIWRNPGFPSLLVTYGVANDFFISGHTAVAVLGAIEAARLLPPEIALLAALVAFLEAAFVIILRAHYTMDVLAAGAAAWCAADLSMRLCSAWGL